MKLLISYCGGQIYDEPIERGFAKDKRDGYRAAKHSREFLDVWQDIMIGLI